MTALRPRRGSARLRSTLDRVLIHDIKNMGFRLQMLRSNLETHYGDPDFKRSVQELLSSTIDRLDGIVGRWSSEEEHLLIKVALDLNGLLKDVSSGAIQHGRRRGSSDTSRMASPSLSLALGAIPQVWGDPYFLRDALSSLVDNALEAAGPAGRVLIRSFSPRSAAGRRPRAVVEIIDNGVGILPDFFRDRLFRPFETTKPDGVGLGLFTASQIVQHHRGTIRVRSGAGEGTVVRLSFPGLEIES